jgi:hypothetical protein
VYLRPSAVPYFRNSSLILKYRRQELNNVIKINIGRRGDAMIYVLNPVDHVHPAKGKVLLKFKNNTCDSLIFLVNKLLIACQS